MRLVASNIAVNRGPRRIVEDVNFSLEKGEALIVTGENGAGKSTLLRALATLLPIESGRFELFNEGKSTHDIASLRSAINYLGAQNAMKPALTVGENLKFWQDFSADETSLSNEGMGIADALDFVDLEHTVDLPFNYLSTGMKRRVAIARLLVVERPVWIVDEPTSGLDTRSIGMFSNLVQDFCNDGGILIAATHLPLGFKAAHHLEIPRLTSAQAFDPFLEDEANGNLEAIKTNGKKIQ